MITTRDFHQDHGAVFETVGGRETIGHYHRPDRTHKAVRNGVGVIELPYSVIVVEGSDRFEYVNNVITNRVPRENKRGTYALLLDPQGRIRTDMYVYDSDDRLLLFLPPGKATEVADDWEVFIQDVTITVASDTFSVFGIHGPNATEKIASVLSKASPSTEQLTFVQGSLDDVGVTVIRGDDITGEESYEVVCSRENAKKVVDVLVNHGLNAVLFGQKTWNAMTLEAGTPVFPSELEEKIPNVTGITNAVDYDKGCFVGQEVASKVKNRGRPSQRLIGLQVAELPDRNASVFAGDATVGEITRAIDSPMLEEYIAFAYVDYSIEDTTTLTVRIDGNEVTATQSELPFYSGSSQSVRLPHYSPES